MKNHPSRIELLSALNSSDKRFGSHFKSCDWCRMYYEILSEFPFAGEISLPDAPKPWIEKAALLAKAPEKLKVIKRFIANVVFDSWAVKLPAGVRGETASQERRIKFEGAQNSLDLRAERRKNHWEFTARIRTSEGKDIQGVILAGKKKVLADEDGFYQWSSSIPPKIIKLVISGQEVKYPELSWKKSPKE